MFPKSGALPRAPRFSRHGPLVSDGSERALSAGGMKAPPDRTRAIRGLGAIGAPSGLAIPRQVAPPQSLPPFRQEKSL